MLGIGNGLRRALLEQALAKARARAIIPSWLEKRLPASTEAASCVSPHLNQLVKLELDLAARDPATARVIAKNWTILLKDTDETTLEALHTLLILALSQKAESAPQLASAIGQALPLLPSTRYQELMLALRSLTQQHWQLGLEVAAKSPELLREFDPPTFARFCARGRALWYQQEDKAIAFLRMESRLAHQYLKQLQPGLTLQTVRRTLQLYAHSHARFPVEIRSLRESMSDRTAFRPDRSFTDGRTIFLPDRFEGFLDPDDNFRAYKTMTALEVGRIEFGTFSIDLKTHAEFPDHWEISEIASCNASRPPLAMLADALAAFSDPSLARAIFEVLENFRIESRLVLEYPGLKADLDWLAEISDRTQPPEVGVNGWEIVTWHLANRLFLATPPLVRKHAAHGFSTGMPALETLLTDLVRVAAPLGQRDATVQRTLEATQAVLECLQALSPAEAPWNSAIEATKTEEDQIDSSLDPAMSEPGDSASTETGESRASSDTASCHESASVESSSASVNFPYQGQMAFNWLDNLQKLDQNARETALLSETRGPDPQSSQETSSLLPAASHQGSTSPTDEAGGVYYPEWDYRIQDYRDGWCRVVEEPLETGDLRFANRVIAAYGPAIPQIKRQFQQMRREAFERKKRQCDGDELDIDAVVETQVDRRSERSASDRIYIQRRKNVREVAVALLLDMSSSTQQVVETHGRNIIEIEKESLILVAEALHALGDAYAIYGFSGYGRKRVAFYVAKEFDEPYGAAVRSKIGSMSARLENRDGAAIRHVTQKLLGVEAQTRLLILLSDGRPLDCGCAFYYDLYAQEDTRQALLETRKLGVHPFSITVDRKARNYLAKMYGSAHYMILDNTESLPTRLPRFYQRLTS